MHITNYPSITQFEQHVEPKDFRESTKKIRPLTWKSKESFTLHANTSGPLAEAM